eukprot:jgi/Botrbrau1/11040/Bobra.92_2s0012.1
MSFATASTVASVGMQSPSCRIMRSGLAGPAGNRVMPSRVLVARPWQSQCKKSAPDRARAVFPFGGQYGSTGFQGGWGPQGGFTGDYQAAARNWAKAIREMEKAFHAQGGRVRPGVFSDLINMAGSMEEAVSTFCLPVDLEETETSYVLRADVPGMEKTDLTIKVNAQERTLVISGERRRVTEAPEVVGDAASDVEAKSDPETSHDNKYKRRFERRVGKFERKFNLADNADLEQVSARVEKGVLTLHMGKVQEMRPDVRDVFIA